MATAATGGQDFRHRWAMGLVGDTSLGPRWRTTGPGLGDVGVDLDEIDLNAGGTVGVIVGSADRNGNGGLPLA